MWFTIYILYRYIVLYTNPRPPDGFAASWTGIRAIFPTRPDDVSFILLLLLLGTYNNGNPKS